MNSFTKTTVLSSINAQHKSICIHHAPENSQNMETTGLSSDSNQQTSEQELSVNSAMQGNTSHSDDQGENNEDFLPVENNGQLPDQCNNYEALESESTVETTYDDNSDHENQLSSTHRLSPLGCDSSEVDTPSVLNVENEMKELSIENNGGAIPKHKTGATHISGELPFENNGGAIPKHKTGATHISGELPFKNNGGAIPKHKTGATHISGELPFKNNGGAVHKHTTGVTHISGELSIENNGGAIHKHKTGATHQFIVPKYHVSNYSQMIVTRPVPLYPRVSGFSTLVPSTQCAVCTSRSVSIEMDGPETTEPTYGSELEIPLTIVQEPSMSDILLLFTEEDEEIAHEFRDHLLTVIEVDNLTVDCMNDVNLGQSEISSLHRLHDSHINILALITPNLKRDDYQCFVNEVLLVLGLRNADKKHRFIPVWMSEEKPIIPELIVFEKSGIDYFRFKSYTLEFLRKSYKKKIVKKILEGRQKFL